MATADGERVFLRKASGLIKTASTSDVFIYDIGLVSIGLGLGVILYFGPAVYPGGNLYIATLLAGIAMLLVMAILIPSHGMQGAALARLVYGPVTCLAYVYVYRIISRTEPHGFPTRSPTYKRAITSTD